MKKKTHFLHRLLNVYTIVGVFFVLLATVFLLAPYIPYVWYKLNDDASIEEVDQIAAPADPDSDADDAFSEVIDPVDTETDNTPTAPELPPLDTSLPKVNVLSIPKIGVKGEIHEGQDAHAALEEGMWRVYDYGTPEDFTPMIVAAHRFGYLSWTTDFRTTQSFYNLPKTTIGDTIEIVWKQRKYEYKITVAEDSTVVVDHDADLILYTCRLFNSPVRVFRYAERTN